MKKHVVGVCFGLVKKPTKGMAKKVEVQEKKNSPRPNDNFFVYIQLTLKDSHSFNEQKETTMISKEYT